MFLTMPENIGFLSLIIKRGVFQFLARNKNWGEFRSLNRVLKLQVFLTFSQIKFRGTPEPSSTINRGLFQILAISKIWGEFRGLNCVPKP
jgi:hypothetical protein